ncbi:MAG: hypothetical protein AB7G40_16925 [Hyphomonadaceae bacterium]
MFGKRSGGPVPRTTRFILGAIASLVGAGVLWQAFNISAGRVEGATGSPTIYFFAFAMLGMGLTVFIGALAGVGDRGERPAAIGLPMRLLLDAFGYMWAAGFAGFAAYMALSPDLGGGAAAIIGRSVFGLFALLIGGFTLVALLNALSRALRGLLYEDGSPPPT